MSSGRRTLLRPDSFVSFRSARHCSRRQRREAGFHPIGRVLASRLAVSISPRSNAVDIRVEEVSALRNWPRVDIGGRYSESVNSERHKDLTRPRRARIVVLVRAIGVLGYGVTLSKRHRRFYRKIFPRVNRESVIRRVSLRSPDTKFHRQHGA